jgi:hypothetical protein
MSFPKVQFEPLDSSRLGQPLAGGQGGEKTCQKQMFCDLKAASFWTRYQNLIIVGLAGIAVGSKSGV